MAGSLDLATARLRLHTSVHTQQGNCTTNCNENTILHLCPTQPCAHTALLAHSMLDWSRLLFLQRYWSRIVLYASQAQSLIRYAADLFGSVTGSSQMLGTYMTESYVVFLAITHSSHFCSWKPPVRLLHALPCHQWLEQPADKDCGCSEACHSLPRVGLRHFGRSGRRGSLRWLPFPG
jgi:hypothetical protein